MNNPEQKSVQSKMQKFLVNFLFSAMFNNLKQFNFPQLNFFLFIFISEPSQEKSLDHEGGRVKK